MKMLSLIFVLLFTATANAYPTLYDLWGKTTDDGKGRLVGSYIYDPVSNVFYDYNVGAIYTEFPNYANTRATISLRSDRSINFNIAILNDVVRVSNISDGFMPLYSMGLPDDNRTPLDSSWLDGSHAVRLNAVDFIGNGAVIGPIYDVPRNPATGWPFILYTLPQWQQPVHKIGAILPGASVPEASSLIILGSSLLLLPWVKRMIM